MLVKFELKVNERVVATSILVISLIFALASITIAYAGTPSSPGYLEWYNPNTGNWELVPPSPNHLDLLPEDLPIELRICGIPLPDCTTIQIQVSNEEWLFDLDDRVRHVEDGCVSGFPWPIPEYPEYTICQTNVVHYRVLTPGGNYYGWTHGNTEVVDGIIGGPDAPAHIHIIPEFPFGTAMSLLPLLSGLGLYAKFRKK